MIRPHLAARIADYAWITRQQVATALVRTPPEAWSDGLGPPIVLLPGVWERWPIMAPLADRLNAVGHPIHVVPGLGFNRRPILDAAARVAARLDELDPTKPIVAYCHHGVRSATARKLLAERGFTASHLEGGIDAWARDREPEMTRY